MLILLIFYCVGYSIAIPRDIVQTTTGKVRGKLVQYKDVSYYSYLGIPFAEAPIGPLRFAPPVPKKPWRAVLDATSYGPVCPQKDTFNKKSMMSEDCLHVNVHVPNLGYNRYPVLVFIHGGDLTMLSARTDVVYGPELYMTQGIIVAMMNYRLGALGFLSVGTEDASGNAALKDVLLSLKWIQKNIAAFGGDPDNITLGGHSAGAALAHYLMLTPRSTGLFHRVILNSGSALCYRYLTRYPLQNAINLGRELGCQTDSPEVLLKGLREANMFDIVEAQESMGANDARNCLRPFAPFVPCIENEYSHSIITREPLDIIKYGIPQNVPILTGLNAYEGIKAVPYIKRNPDLLNDVQKNFELAIPTDILYPYGLRESVYLAYLMKQYYFGYKKVSKNNTRNFIDLSSDTLFTFASDRWIRLHKNRNSSSDVYYYMFDFDGELNWFKLYRNIHESGASHGDEVGYSFLTNSTKHLYEKAGFSSLRTFNNTLELWTNFVKYGEPTPRLEVPSKKPFYVRDFWEKVEDGEERKHFVINDQPGWSIETHFLKE